MNHVTVTGLNKAQMENSENYVSPFLSTRALMLEMQEEMDTGQEDRIHTES